MTKNQTEFLNLFFNPGETFCVSPGTSGYHSVSEISSIMTLEMGGDHHIVHKVKEEDIVLMALNPIDGFRNDDSVTKFRSFLVEVDFGDLKEQYDWVKSMNMPFSCCVYSGNKSLHFGIVLEQELEDSRCWRHIAEWILNIMDKADQVTKNPSRSIRFPDNMRKDGKGLKQSLIKMNGRVKNKDLLSWLYRYEHLKPVVRITSDRKKSDEQDIKLLSGWLKKQLYDKQIDFSIGRSNRWHSIAFDFGMAGFEYEDVQNFLEDYFEPDNDFRRQEWISTLKSGWKGAQRKI